MPHGLTTMCIAVGASDCQWESSPSGPLLTLTLRDPAISLGTPLAEALLCLLYLQDPGLTLH